MQVADHSQNHSQDHSHEHSHRREHMLELVKLVILGGLTLYFAYNIVSGNLANYVNVRFAWLSYVAVAIFGALCAASVYRLLLHSHDHAHDHGHHDHSHARFSWPALVIVAVPLALGTLVPSEPLGAAAVNGSISISAVAVDTSSAFERDPLDRNVLDWLRVFRKGSPGSFNGEPADVIGFVYREPGYDDDIFMVARFTVSCCVADANAIALPVRWQGTLDLADSEWVRVQGTFEAGDFQNVQTPILVATSVEVVDQPSHPYLYP